MPKNGNITGQVFDDGVIKQIETRQQFLGVRNKTDKHLIFQNNQNAFLRLASSVNVGNPPPDEGINQSPDEGINQSPDEGINQLKDRDISQSLAGMELAKACVLFGGIVGLDDKLNPKYHFGLYNSNEDPISTIAAYGWGGVGSRGYVPMPSIESANIGFYNRGALQKAEVKIKVYSLEQLQIFDLLYFRIGYTMLLEWGHNIWVTNEGELKNRTDFVTEAFSKFFAEGSDQNTIIKAIQDQRKNDDYNYDAMLGKVTNFTWKFNDDGSYDINLKLIGLGDIIESLKINKAPIATNKTELSPSQELTQQDNNITAGENAADNKDAQAQKAAEEAEKQLTEAVDEYSALFDKKEAYDTSKGVLFLDVLTPGSPNYLSYDLSTIYFDMYELGIGEENSTDDLFDVNGGKIVELLGGAGALNTDSNPTQIIADLREANGYIQEIYTDGLADDTLRAAPIEGKKWQKYAQVFEAKVNALIAILNKAKNLFDNNAAAKARSEAQSKESERVKSALARSRQRVEAEKEKQSLSPLTSVETKNKTLFNQQLYQWRTEAQAGQGQGNLFKINFTANSANPDSTGVKTHSLDFYYVRLGYLLDWIEENLLVYDNTKTTEDGKPIPMFTLDTTPDTNLCLRFPGQFSSDPNICLVPSKYQSEDPNGVSWDVLNELNNYYVDGNEYAGKLMNMMVNIDGVAGVLDKNLDGNGKVNLNKFLNELFKNINDVLGNVNKLEPVFDTENNKLTIIEGSSIENAAKGILDKEKESNKMGVFQVYGIGNISEPIGSFVTNIDFQVQLPPNMAAMATISAQANGNIVGENATGLSKLNVGLTDRLITVKLDKDSIEGVKVGKDDPKKIYEQNLSKLKTIITDLYANKNYAKDSVSSGRSINRDIALYITGNEAQTGKMPSPFFIPFNLSVDMVGLSGMRNYERFSITEEVLPYSYRSSEQGGVINFLIKGLTHNIDDNKWTTKIESLTVGAKRETL